jgi:alcohol dehydrogenase class IV
MGQTIIEGRGSFKELGAVLASLDSKRCFLVCGHSFMGTKASSALELLPQLFVSFSGVHPNPTTEDVIAAVKNFRESDCDVIVAVGGGSVIDVAKCVKLFAERKIDASLFDTPYVSSAIPLVACPTTAGTGSESTCFSVAYKDSVKLSIEDKSILPDFVILDSAFLDTLPLYQKKCTLLDALCQAIESWWSKNSTEESIRYSKEAIDLTTHAQIDYLRGSEAAAKDVLLGANLAGRAINITKTTAPHAMSYQLTSHFGIPHGHAVAVCLPAVWGAMLDNSKICNDVRGFEYVSGVFCDIACALGSPSPSEAIATFNSMLEELQIEPPSGVSLNEIQDIAHSVNQSRLSNSPIQLDDADILNLYANILA